MNNIKNNKVDVLGILASALCIVHCLFLPILALAIPALKGMLEAEWLHILLLALIAPVTIYRAYSNLVVENNKKLGLTFVVGGLLVLGGFLAEEILHNDAISLSFTFIGCTSLAIAHFFYIQVQFSEEA